jgi:hypothetical protein
MIADRTDNGGMPPLIQRDHCPYFCRVGAGTGPDLRADRPGRLGVAASPEMAI